MLHLIVIGLALGGNDFPAALALGSLGQKDRRWVVAPLVGLAHLVVVWIGLALGRGAALGPLLPWAHEIAPFVLGAVGLWMLLEAMRPGMREKDWAARVSTVRGATLVALGMSLDSLLVAFGLGLKAWDPSSLAVIAAVISTGAVWLGMTVGERVARGGEKQAEGLSALLILALAAAAALDWI